MKIAVSVLILLIITSRLLISSHFVHQVILEVLVGMLVYSFTTHSRVFESHIQV